MEMTFAIEVRDLHYRYHDGTEALRGVSLVIGEGEGSVANLAQGIMKGQWPLSVWGLSREGVEQFGRSEALFSGLHHHLSFLEHVQEFASPSCPMNTSTNNKLTMPCGCRMSWPIKKEALHVDHKVVKF